MFEIRNVSKRFGNVKAIQPTTLTISPGKTTVLIGPSGCGKSTLLKLLLGLVFPDEGIVLFEGTPITRENCLQLRRNMGYVVQEGGLFPHLTAEQNVSLMARYLKYPPHEIQARLRDLADMVQIPLGVLKRYPSQLSGGQRQRVSLMRALMLNPEVLLLDEPLGALDPMIRADLQEDLRNIFQNLKKTVVMVTHDMGEAAFFADVIVLMREGQVVQQGSFEELATQPAEEFVSQFIRAQRVSALSLLKGSV
ncbi:MAG: ATP-binding cassette domain-containing protein [Fimbriimonadales bacterium]|nr:ATP-binding cassette domain-containing protein [Fimbriimonadales bacterium]